MKTGLTDLIMTGTENLTNKIMPNKILKIILKPNSGRSLWELLELIQFYNTCTSQQFKYAMGLEYHLRNENI